MSRKKRLASITSAGLVFAMLLSQSSVANLGAEVVKAADDTENWVDTGKIVNGDFANADTVDDDWTISIPKDTETWKYGSGAENGYYCIWENKSDTAIDVSMSQTVKLEAGTYKVSMKSTGKTDGLKLKAGEYVSSDIEASTWSDDKNEWILTETDEFTLDEENDVVISVEGTVEPNSKQGCAIDDIVLYEKETDSDYSDENQEGYKLTATKSVSSENVATGDEVSFKAKVKKDGKELSEEELAKLHIYWYTDQWLEGHDDGIIDNTAFGNADDNGSVDAVETTYTFNNAGTYYIVAKLQDENWKDLGIVSFKFVVTDSEDNEPDVPVADSDIYVDKVNGLTSDFIRGVDISSVVSEYNSGVKYYDFDGNELALTSKGGKKTFFDFLSECGINWVRVRVWNDPTTADGKSYGGGANDLATAKLIGKAATEAGLKVLIDFHYSDFWADPNMQGAPKAWENMTVDEKAAALSEYTTDSLEELLAAGIDVGMVQVGNETNNGLAGEKTGYTNGEIDLTDLGKLYNAGSKAVKAEAAKYNKDILVAVHYTNVQDAGYYERVAAALQKADVDYDVFATSYYPFWHGATSNLTSVMKTIAKKYDKKVMVAETSYAYTLADGDGHDNNVKAGAAGLEFNYSVSVQGQANAVADVIRAVKAIGDDGLGMFYWEPAWIPVQYAYNEDGSVNEEILASNKATWEKYGSGWASSYSYEYDPDNAGLWYGGSSWDNQAMFDYTGHPLESINVYKYVLSGTTAKAQLERVADCEISVYADSDWEMPSQVKAVYTDNKNYDVDVTWDASQVEAAKKAGVGTYEINGTVEANGKIYNLVCTLTVQYPNLLLNPGFEDEDMSMWNITGDGVGREADNNKRSGTYSLKFWSASPVDYTVSQKVTLDAGKYDLSAYVQGGDAGDDPTFQLYMKVNGKTYTVDTGVTSWQNWSDPSITGVEITEDGTEVEIGVITKAAAGAWGAWDDFYLCRTGDVSSDDDKNDDINKDDNKNNGSNTGDNNKDNGSNTGVNKDNGTNTGINNKDNGAAGTGNSTSNGNKVTTPKATKTSDENNMYMWLVLAMAGIGVTIAVATKRKSA